MESETSNEFPIFSTYELLEIDVGSFATPQLIDLNRDGLLDLIIGERMGIDNGVYNGINYYQNIGSFDTPEFENYTPEFPSGDYDENFVEIITKSLGGTLSGEHGIGLVQKDYMDIVFSDKEITFENSTENEFAIVF